MTQTLVSRAFRAGTAAVWWLARRRAIRDATPGAAPKAALLAIVTSALLMLITAALGTSAAVQPWPGVPPLSWHAQPGPVTVTTLLAAATIIGSYGVLGCLSALRRGWSPDPARLWAASTLVVVAFVLLPPVGSADPGSYVGYGRLAVAGHDPYATAPDALTGAYGQVVEDPWRTTTSVYGPLATGEQWLAVKLAGGGAHGPAHAVFVLDLINGLAFAGTGLLLFALAATKPGRRRVAVLFSANPLLMFAGVAGAHLDVVLTCLAVGAVAALRRPGVLPAFVAGLLGGAAAAIKASAALVGIGLAWATQRESRPPAARLAALAAGAAAVLVPGYLLAGGHAFDQLGHASGFVSFADPWRLVTHPLEITLGRGPARELVRVAAWAAFVVFASLFDRGLPGRREVGVPATPAARGALVLVLAWLLTAPYVLPWYGVVAFALLALLPASGYDRVLVIWTATLIVAYLPGRQVTLPAWLHDVLDAWKSGLAPVVLFGVAITAAVLSLRERH